MTKGLSPDDVGVFALGLALSAPVMFLANLGLRTTLVTDIASEFEFGNYLTLRIATSVAGVAVIAVIAALAGYTPVEAMVVLAVSVGKAIDNVSDIVHGAFQKIEKLDVPAVGMMLNGVLSLVLLSSMVALTGNVVWAAIGSLAGSTLSLTAYNLPTAKRTLGSSASGRRSPVAPIWDLGVQRRLIVLSAPLGIAYLLTSLNLNAPRYAIDHYLGSYELGIFSALAYLLTIGPTVMGALSQAMLPRAAALYGTGQRRPFASLVIRLVGFAVASGMATIIVAWSLGSTIVAAVYTREYARHESVLIWLTVAMTMSFVVWFLDLGLGAARRFSVQAAANVATLAATVVLSIALIPGHGLVGATWALTGGLLVQVVVKAAVLRRSILVLGPQPAEQLA